MADIYDTLIGAAPTDKDRAAEIAAALRRRRSYGELGMLSGDRVLAPAGERMVKQADDYAGAIQDTRRHDIDDAQTKSYQDSQLGHMNSVLKETMRGRDMMDATTRRGQDLAFQAAQLKAAAAGAKTNKPPKLTYSDRNKLENLSNTLHGAMATAAGFQPEYSQMASPGPIPEVGQSRLVNGAASLGLGTGKMQEAANWWSQWNLIYTLPQRNATFGATLTPGEKQAWFESDINPSMKPEQIQKRIQKVIEILGRKGDLATKTYKAQGFAPDVIDSYELGGAGPTDDPAMPSASALSPDEEAELAALRKKHLGQ